MVQETTNGRYPASIVSLNTQLIFIFCLRFGMYTEFISKWCVLGSCSRTFVSIRFIIPNVLSKSIKIESSKTYFYSVMIAIFHSSRSMQFGCHNSPYNHVLVCTETLARRCFVKNIFRSVTFLKKPPCDYFYLEFLNKALFCFGARVHVNKFQIISDCKGIIFH